MSDQMNCGGSEKEFFTGNGVVRLLRYQDHSRLLIIPTHEPGTALTPAFERDYSYDQHWMAERDFETIYRALWG